MKKLSVNTSTLKYASLALAIVSIFVNNEASKRTIDDSAEKAVAKHIEEHPELFQK